VKALAAAVLWLLLATPLQAQDDVQQGRTLYTSYCARCHGVNMVNTGAATDLRKFPKDEQERFERSVNQGVRAMPAWGGVLQPGEVQAIWRYVISNPQ
jgi:mono/diheme cytochrome c family protein